MNKLAALLLWPVIAIVGAISFGALALGRGETVSATWLVTAALAVYFIAYRFYSKFIAERVLQLDDTRPTPAVRHNDGMDYVPTNKWVLFGHHFAAIAGAGPLVCPVLAAQMGYLPGTLWILAGVVVAGAVQDFIVLFASVRRAGHHDHHPRGVEPGRRQGADGQPMGAVHDRGHDPDRPAYGHLHAGTPAGARGRSLGDWRDPAAGRAVLRPRRGRRSNLGTAVHVDRHPDC